MSSLGQMTLAEIRLAAQQRSDQVNSNFITTQEWNSWINQSYYELYDLLVQKYGNDYFVQTPYTFTTDGVNYLFALPNDFYKVLGVDYMLPGNPNTYVPMKRFDFGDRGPNPFQGQVPTSGQNIRIWYVPRMTELVNDSDICDGVSGWTEYIIVDVAAKALEKEESDSAPMMARKGAILQRIEAAAENRDAASPQTVLDSQSMNYFWPYNGSYPYAQTPLRYRLQGNNIWLANSWVGGGY